MNEQEEPAWPFLKAVIVLLVVSGAFLLIGVLGGYGIALLYLALLYVLAQVLDVIVRGGKPHPLPKNVKELLPPAIAKMVESAEAPDSEHKATAQELDEDDDSDEGPLQQAS